MSPDKSRRRRSEATRQTTTEIRTKPSAEDEHDVVYFRRHPDDDPTSSIPAREFLRNVCPPTVRARFDAILVAVAAAPPTRFAGGGYWEAMHGEMTGWFEVRVDGPQRRHYRLYCLLDLDAEGREKPLLVVIGGLGKAFRTTLSKADYKAIRDLGVEYLHRNPRSLA